MVGNYKNKEEMELTKKKAIELSILKWEWIVENNGSSDGLRKELPELKKLVHGCGLCQLYIFNSKCFGCPILLGDKYCGCKLHPHCTWTKNRTKENAQAVLDLIKSIKIKGA